MTGTVLAAAATGAGTVIVAFIAWRSNRAATKLTTQTQAQTSVLESVDRRISEAFDATGAENTRLAAEITRYQEREAVLLDRIAKLERAFQDYREKTDGQLSEQGQKLSALTNELHGLRSNDEAWRRWAGTVLAAYATVVERLHRATGEDSPLLPPSPPLA
jgi:chromosome segregation ATPase